MADQADYRRVPVQVIIEDVTDNDLGGQGADHRVVFRKPGMSNVEYLTDDELMDLLLACVRRLPQEAGIAWLAGTPPDQQIAALGTLIAVSTMLAADSAGYIEGMARMLRAIVLKTGITADDLKAQGL
jgi:hypothetical protein